MADDGDVFALADVEVDVAQDFGGFAAFGEGFAEAFDGEVAGFHDVDKKRRLAFARMRKKGVVADGDEDGDTRHWMSWMI